MLKIKSVQFNTEQDDQKQLLDAINNSGLNFSSETKKMWAKKLKVKFTQTYSGRPKVNHEND